MPNWSILEISTGIIKINSPLCTSRVFHASLMHFMSEYCLFDSRSNICCSHRSPSRSRAAKPVKESYAIFINVCGGEVTSPPPFTPHCLPIILLFFCCPTRWLVTHSLFFQSRITADSVLMFHETTHTWFQKLSVLYFPGINSLLTFFITRYGTCLRSLCTLKTLYKFKQDLDVWWFTGCFGERKTVALISPASDWWF